MPDPGDTPPPHKLKVAAANSLGCCYPSGPTGGSNVSLAPYTSCLVVGGGGRGPQRRNSLHPARKLVVAPRRKKISSPRPRTPALVRSCYSREISHPQSGHAPTFPVHRCPFWPIRVFSYLQILAACCGYQRLRPREARPRRAGYCSPLLALLAHLASWDPQATAIRRL